MQKLDSDSSDSETEADKRDKVTVEDEADLPEEDEEGGRFFEDGLNTKGREVLDWVDMGEELEEEEINSLYFKKQILKLEKFISKNSELRTKYSSEPKR